MLLTVASVVEGSVAGGLVVEGLVVGTSLSGEVVVSGVITVDWSVVISESGRAVVVLVSI